MAEEWRPAPGWPAYEVSTRGRVRSVDRQLTDGRAAGGKLLKPSKDKDGYRYVTLASGPGRWRVHVGRLVLFAFAGWPDDPAMEACHGNGRRWDNRLANLRWDTRPANRADRERHRRERAGVEVRGMEDGGESEIDVAAPCPFKPVPAEKEVPGQGLAETGGHRC